MSHYLRGSSSVRRVFTGSFTQNVSMLMEGNIFIILVKDLNTGAARFSFAALMQEGCFMLFI